MSSEPEVWVQPVTSCQMGELQIVNGRLWSVIFVKEYANLYKTKLKLERVSIGSYVLTVGLVIAECRKYANKIYK